LFIGISSYAKSANYKVTPVKTFCNVFNKEKVKKSPMTPRDCKENEGKIQKNLKKLLRKG